MSLIPVAPLYLARSRSARPLPLRLNRPCRSPRSLHCISLAPARLDRYPRGVTGPVAHPGRSIVSRSLPLVSTATLAALPALSLTPVAPFAEGFHRRGDLRLAGDHIAPDSQNCGCSS